jgi:NAD(P)-dependent dehydrogenase (short-subunit alcohol dehydrogenase family)
VADPAEAEAAVAEAVARFGALHVLVNNAAAFIADCTAETIALPDWDRTLAVNVTGPMLMSRAAIPRLRAAGGGSIIHVASQLGQVGRAGRFWYGAAKAALIHMARGMAIDHAADGIRVNSLSPGPIATARTVGAHRRAGGGARLLRPADPAGPAGHAGGGGGRGAVPRRRREPLHDRRRPPGGWRLQRAIGPGPPWRERRSGGSSARRERRSTDGNDG